jgi:anti-sigma regulatory factor (Ser/Thr protein kinase)
VDVHIYVPNSAFLGNIESFVGRLTSGDGDLDITMNESWISVHPVVLAMIAAAGAEARQAGHDVRVASSPAGSLHYLVRMGLYEHLGVPAPTSVVAHEAAGRFIPLAQIRTPDQLGEFIVDMVPLLHDPEHAGPIKYVVSELVRNALEHARSANGAFVCAQYFKSTKRLSIGVADMGRGIRQSLSESHAVRSDLDGIQKALQPGITGTSSRFGGNEYNAGAGLFFTKSIARASRNFFVVYSGDALFKLLKGPEASPRTLLADASQDRATRHEGLPRWHGTAIGIDLAVDAHETFQQLLTEIYGAYHLEVKSASKDRFRKARFT